MSEENKAPTLWQVTKSVLAAGFGVQSNENRERDFKHGKPGQFIVIALIFTLLFVLAVWGLVVVVMKLAGV
ncbi:MAG: DUF2970 domain-containing protein [Gammaproteobacteria bacterium]|nr:DUF2970 domain-containing protein [Gammaproteobacteria bacterium]